MPAPTQCPISEVNQALLSYIYSRDETIKTRRALSKYLTASLRPVTSATQSQHLNFECSYNISTATTTPPGLKDLRFQYLEALRGRNRAQTRHRELQASLEELQQRHVDEHPTQQPPNHDNETIRGYVSLLTQRRRLAELYIIKDSLEKLLNARPTHASSDPKEMIKVTLGEQPDLPAERLEQLIKSQDEQAGVFKLKQEVLAARTSLHHANAARQKAQSEPRSQTSLKQQVHALELARDEIVEWVQAELAKLEEDSVFLEDASPVKRPVEIAAPMDLASAENHIMDAYKRYTTSRVDMLASCERLQQPVRVVVEPADDNQNPTQAANDPKVSWNIQSSVTKILPHLVSLAQKANNERALLQQSLYLQTQLSSADKEIEEALLRLSGESHLLPAGTKEVSAWGKAAGEAEKATTEFVQEELRGSRREMESVSAVVEITSLQSRVLSLA